MIRPIQPASVLLIGADYATNLAVPHNVYGRAGLEGIREFTVSRDAHHLWGRSKLRRVNDAVVTLDSAARWGEVVDGLRRHGFPGNTIVIFLALHAVAGSEGNVYLLPDDASKPTDGVELATIIDDLGTLPSNKAKILILEGAQIQADWRLGVGHNDFARRLRQLDENGAIAKVPGLWILSASDVDQRCWVSDGLRRTVFAHFVIEGLRGAAAGDDRRVDLAELYKFVRRNVSDWVWAARGTVQEPILLPEKPVGREARNVVLALANERARRPNRPQSVQATVTIDRPEGARMPKALEDRWREFERLGALDPHPSAYASGAWAAYRATLIRYEQLTRAGAAPVTVGELADELDRLRDHLESDRRERHRRLPLSAGNSLSLIALRGGTVGTPASPQLDRLWAAPDPEFERALAEYRRLASPDVDSGLSSLQTRAEGFLYVRAEEDPEANLAKAAQRLAQLQEPDVPLSAEAHFLTMLEQGRGDPLNGLRSSYWNRLGQALRVRRLAELAALGVAPGSAGPTPSEQLVPWIATRVEQADESRRRGEDLLFATSESERNDASVALDRAEAAYKASLARAGALRRAIALRDRAMADLPEYARWLADRPSYEGAMIQTVRDLLDRAHDLDRRLEQPSDDLDVVALNQQIDEFSARMRVVEHAFDAERERVDTSRSAEDWESATAAVAVAPSHPDLLAMRRSLWRRLANIAVSDRKLADSRLGGPAVPSMLERRRSDRVRNLQRACVQLETAMTVLGRDLFDDRTLRAWYDNGPGTLGTDRSPAREPDYEAIAGRLGELRDRLSQKFSSEAALSSVLDSGQGDGWGVLSRAGDQIGRRWRGLVTVIDRLVANGDLALAGRYGRRVDGTAPGPLRSGAEPASTRRDVQIGDTLAWLAERTWTDHWYDRKPQETPYYRAAGSRYLADLDQILRSHRVKAGLNTPPVLSRTGDWPRSLESVQSLFQRKDQLGFDQPGAIVLTTEQSYRVSSRLTGMAPELAGVPVVWAEPESSSLLRLEGPSRGQRVAWEQGGVNRSPQTISFQISCPILDEAASKPTRPSVQRTALVVRGSFRGQQFERRTDVLVHPVPDAVSTVPPPHGQNASIAIRADQEVFERFGEGRGAIAIVLDGSGSMGKPEAGTKFHDARKALATILRTMPRGTTISIWGFGFESRGYLRHDPIAVDNNKNPERTIRRILGPVRWDPSQVVVLDRELDGLEPVHGTPLVHAMVKAAEDLDRSIGFKTMLVLTDGKDTRFTSDAALNPGKLTIPAFLAKRFGHAGIAIHMVAFKVEDGELAEARSQFAGVLEQLDPPGHFIAVGESSRLVTVLRHSIRPGLVCQLGRVGGGPSIGLEVAHPDEPDRWLVTGLEPGRYTLKVRADRPAIKGVELEPGDRMIVRLGLQSDGTLSFQRTLFSDDFPAKRPFAEAGGWRFAVLQNRHVPESNRLEMQAALEPLDAPGSSLSLHKPGLTWFELMPRTARATPFTVRWRPQTPSPAPLWSIDVPEWPAIDDSQGPDWPTLRVWWHPDSHRPITLVQRGEHFPTPAGIDHLKVLSREGDTVTIESVQVELHHVEARAGESREPTPCLVVRLEHPAGKPYWVDSRSLADLDIAGQEHRFFAGAGKYTGLFWPVSQSRMDAALRRLGLVSVAQLRRDAEDHGRRLELQLGPPRADDPPIELPGVDESTHALESAPELRAPLPIPD